MPQVELFDTVQLFGLDGAVSPNRRKVTQARVNPATMVSRSSGGLLPWKT
jgi:hypothetical protein